MKKVLLPDVTKALNDAFDGWYCKDASIKRTFIKAVEGAGYKNLVEHSFLITTSSISKNIHRYKIEFIAGDELPLDPLAIYYNVVTESFTAYSLTPKVTCFYDIINAIDNFEHKEGVRIQKEIRRVEDTLQRKYNISLDDAFDIEDLLSIPGDYTFNDEIKRRKSGRHS